MAGRRERHSVGSMSTVSGPIIAGVDGDAGAADVMALGTRLAELLDVPVEPVTVPGHGVSAVLRETATHEGAALIVLGPTYRHGLRTLRGTARRVLGAAECPVVVAPAGFASRPDTTLRRVGVGFEPTPDGRHALDMAADLAARADGSLLAIGVALPLAPLAIDDARDRAPYLDEERRIVQDGLERELASLPAGVPCHAQARIGDPAVELAEVSRELDLLVCGSRGRGPLRAVLLGSVTERLLRFAACPVMIVPRAA
jgi:nucleotide-binding universal stress UspA family protein